MRCRRSARTDRHTLGLTRKTSTQRAIWAISAHATRRPVRRPLSCRPCSVTGARCGGERVDLEKTDRGVDEKDVIEALGKGLRVIEAFDNDHAFLTPSEAAKASGITRTAARRYLLSLCHFGYADTDGRRFWLLPRVLRLGQSYLAGARLPRLVHPFIQRVAQQLGEAVSLSALDGHDVVYLAHSSSPRLFNIGFQVG